MYIYSIHAYYNKNIFKNQFREWSRNYYILHKNIRFISYILHTIVYLFTTYFIPNLFPPPRQVNAQYSACYFPENFDDPNSNIGADPTYQIYGMCNLARVDLGIFDESNYPQ